MATGITICSQGSAGDDMSNLTERVVGGNGPTSTIADGQYGSATMNGRGETLIAQGLPYKSEFVRRGRSFHASIPTGSAFTTVAAWPTTRAELVLSNIGAAGGPSIIIDSVWAATIVTETAASALTILVQLSPANLVAVATNNTAVLQRCLNGKAGNATSAIAALAVANTAFGVASQWHVAPRQTAMGTNLAAVSVGQATTADIDGLYVVPPGATFLMNAVVGTAVASAGIIGVVWHEAQVDLG